MTIDMKTGIRKQRQNNKDTYRS